MSPYFSPQIAQQVIDFCECLTLRKTLSGQPQLMKLLPFQKQYIANLFGWRREDGTRLYRKSYFGMGRKNAKTQLVAALALYLLFVENEPSPEIYIAAKDHDQASLVYRAAREMVEDSELRQWAQITESRKVIINTVHGGVLRALSSDGGAKHGLNPSAVIFDELHAWTMAEEELYQALTTAGGARRQPLHITITTAGFDQSSICYREYSYAKKVLSKIVEDPTYYPVIYEAPPDVDWTSDAALEAANPGIDAIISRQYLIEQRMAAINSPWLQNQFRRLHLNQWTAQNERVIPLEKWDACADPAIDFAGLPCFGGLDLSTNQDLTSFALCFPLANRQWGIEAWFWLPSENLIERCRRDGVPYDQWAREGLIELCPGSTIEHEMVFDRIQQLRRQYKVLAIAFDRYGAPFITSKLQQSGIKVIDFGQGMRSMSQPTKDFLAAVLSQKLKHRGNPVLRWNMDCLQCAQDAAGNIKPVKPNRHSDSKRIDGAVASIMAFGIAQTPAQRGGVRCIGVV